MRYNQSVMGAFTGRITSFLGGMVFSKNGTARTYNTPVNPQSASQTEIRAAFEFFQNAWSNTLVQANRDAWEAARISDAYWSVSDEFTGTQRPFSSAKSMFTSVNMNRNIALDQMSSPTVEFTNPGSPTAIDSYGITSLTIDASAQTVVLVYTGTETLDILVIRMTPPVSPGNERLTSVKSKLRTVRAGFGASPVALGAFYTGIFGDITGATGQKVFYTIKAVSNATGKSRFIASGYVTVVA